MTAEPHVVIVGGGFGGLTAAQSLEGAGCRITLIDRQNHHLFQPLLYQVAMAGLSPAEIASPIRSILRRRPDVTVLLDEVRRVELAERRLLLRDTELSFDFLVLATGTQTNYFGRPEWARWALGLKDLEEAIEIRRRVLLAYEAAEREPDPRKREQLLTFVVIGGGPTGVELAGALAELARFALSRDFRVIDSRATRILLLERGSRILASFPEDLSAFALGKLQGLGVEVKLGEAVTEIGPEGVRLESSFIPSSTVIWAAGVRATPLLETLGVPLDRMGRATVEPDLSLPGHPNVFVLGDAAAFLHQAGGQPLPGVAPVAIQQGQFLAQAIRRALRGEARGAFRYWDKGNLATIGRAAAVADLGGRWKFRGLLAWVVWLLVHIIYLIGFRNRAIVLFSWFLSYATYQRGARLITGRRFEPGAS